MFRTAVVLAAAVLAWVHRAIKPPPPKICGSQGGPPVTSPRVKLSDGRYLAYKENGVPKDKAKYTVVLTHGFDSSKDLYLPIPQDLVDELGICIITFDRAGYGESDPNPKRSVRSEAFDIQELADVLELGSKFYLVGISIGSHPTWGCLKYIPHRLAGVALVVPVMNFWWPSFPPQLCSEAFRQQPKRDQWMLRVAHYAPGLLYWWMTQKWFPYSSILERLPIIFSKTDIQTIKKMSQVPTPHEQKIRQQGEYESLHRDLMVEFGKWEFDPLELNNPFPKGEASAHIWQGHEDRLVGFKLQRHVAERLPWIHYHEVPDGGHLIIHDPSMCRAIFRALLLGEKPSFDRGF